MDPFLAFAAPPPADTDLLGIGGSSGTGSRLNAFPEQANAPGTFDESLVCYLFDEKLFTIRDAKNRLRDLFAYINDAGLTNYCNILSVQTFSSRNPPSFASNICDSDLRLLRLDLSLPKSASLQIKEQTFFPSVLFLATIAGVPYIRDLNVDALVTIDNDTLRSVHGRKSVGYAIAEYIALFRQKTFDITPRPFTRNRGGAVEENCEQTRNTADGVTDMSNDPMAVVRQGITCTAEINDSEIDVQIN